MKLLSWFKKTDTGPDEKRSVNLSRLDGYFGAPSDSGVLVNEETAFKVATVFACVRVISEGIADMPLDLYEQNDQGISKRISLDSDLYRVIRKPNVEQAPYEFLEMMTMIAALYGEAYALRNTVNGELRELLPLNPGAVTVERRNGKNRYTIADSEEGVNRVVGRKDLFILRGPGISRDHGIEPIKLAREAIGLTLATEKSQAKLHANGGQPNGILTTEESLNDEARSRLATSWKKAFEGANKFKTAVLDGGWKFQQLSMSGVDAQHLETRRFQVEEIARVFKVFPQMIMHTDKTSTFASAESFFNAHYKHTIGPWATRWEQALDHQILDGSGGVYARFDNRELTKASMKDRGDFYRTVSEMGIYTRNELRELEKLPPIDGLDEPLTPMNMQGNENGNEADTVSD